MIAVIEQRYDGELFMCPGPASCSTYPRASQYADDHGAAFFANGIVFAKVSSTIELMTVSSPASFPQGVTKLISPTDSPSRE